MPSSSSRTHHLITAMVTPFTEECRVDVDSLQRLVAFLQQGGVQEFFVLGSTGEAPLLDDPDRAAIVKAVRAAAPSGRIFAGISGIGHRHAIRNAKEVAQAG